MDLYAVFSNAKKTRRSRLARRRGRVVRNAASREKSLQPAICDFARLNRLSQEPRNPRKEPFQVDFAYFSVPSSCPIFLQFVLLPSDENASAASRVSTVSQNVYRVGSVWSFP